MTVDPWMPAVETDQHARIVLQQRHLERSEPLAEGDRPLAAQLAHFGTPESPAHADLVPAAPGQAPGAQARLALLMSEDVEETVGRRVGSDRRAAEEAVDRRGGDEQPARPQVALQHPGAEHLGAQSGEEALAALLEERSAAQRAGEVEDTVQTIERPAEPCCGALNRATDGGGIGDVEGFVEHVAEAFQMSESGLRRDAERGSPYQQQPRPVALQEVRRHLAADPSEATADQIEGAALKGQIVAGPRMDVRFLQARHPALAAAPGDLGFAGRQAKL